MGWRGRWGVSPGTRVPSRARWDIFRFVFFPFYCGKEIEEKLEKAFIRQYYIGTTVLLSDSSSNRNHTRNKKTHTRTHLHYNLNVLQSLGTYDCTPITCLVFVGFYSLCTAFQIKLEPCGDLRVDIIGMVIK